MYKNFTLDEARDIGKKFIAVCDWGGSYHLTPGKQYEIEITPRILTCSPLCSFIDDRGIKAEAHLDRFTKIKELQNEP